MKRWDLLAHLIKDSDSGKLKVTAAITRIPEGRLRFIAGERDMVDRWLEPDQIVALERYYEKRAG